MLERGTFGHEKEGVSVMGNLGKDFGKGRAFGVFQGILVVELDALHCPLPCCEGDGAEGGWEVVDAHVFWPG
jgi:hypothetical protein